MSLVPPALTTASFFFVPFRNTGQEVEETAQKNEGELEGVATGAGDAATQPPTAAAADTAANVPSTVPQESSSTAQEAAKDLKDLKAEAAPEKTSEFDLGAVAFCMIR